MIENVRSFLRSHQRDLWPQREEGLRTSIRVFLGPMSSVSMVLQFHGRPHIPSSLDFANIPSIISSAERRGTDPSTSRVGQIVPILLIVGLAIAFVFTLARIVMGWPGFPFRCRIRSASTNITGYVSRVVRSSADIIPSFVGPGVSRRNTLSASSQTPILPLHRLSRESPLPTDPERPPTGIPALPPRVYDPREPQHPHSHFLGSHNAFQAHNASQHSFAPSETPTYQSAWSDCPTLVPNLAAGRRF
ncbi:hypothetical protein MSAN_01378400 [Mycena sanguinolenta]|uniref:Uncharacterized protein n=1 Tax=Mycena sanguinolenta TaxID=230812 RepID=A0A8H6Y5L6_9AGAR|nr:hypothetical protein MSAN_01378400 [Mycena sanguinolenta]